MILRSVEAQNFRNLAGKNLWGDGLNILYGNNGQGKTNWLEAIYVLAHTKSFRTSKLQEAIQFGADAAYLRAEVAQTEHISRELQVSIQGKTKTISVNGKVVQKVRSDTRGEISFNHRISGVTEKINVDTGN